MPPLGYPTWRIGYDRSIILDRPRLMGILNVTPDSFSDGGKLTTPELIVEAARSAIRDGADALDIGGESTRPGAQRVSVVDQIARVIPAIREIRRAGIDAPISVDTTRARVAAAALDAGGDIINDVSGGLEDERMLGLAAERGCGLILMHRLAPPDADSYSDQYTAEPGYTGGVVAGVRTFLAGRLAAAAARGVAAESILLDPGLGFGKGVEQNLELIAGTGELLTLGRPILSATSRKSFVGRVSLGRASDPGERLAGSLAASVAHLRAGAMVFRVHDVAEQAQALRLGWATQSPARRNTDGVDRIDPPAARAVD